jgi:hypothetical protein
MTKIGIIGAGTGTLPSEVLRMAEEANVEIVELDKDFSPTDIPQFENRVYTIQPRPEFLISNGASLYGLERVVRNVVGVRSKSARTGRKERLIFVEF